MAVDSQNPQVGIYDTGVASYPDFPYSPGQSYPEYRFRGSIQAENRVYDGVRELLFLIGADKEKFGTAAWNPFKKIISPGMRVLVKPNLVNSEHLSGGDLGCVITHPSVIRAVTDYIIIALDGHGEIVVADSPERMADFDKIMEMTRYRELVEFYRKYEQVMGTVSIEVRDLRRESIKYGYGAITHRRLLAGDPEGYTTVDIAEKSAFFGLRTQKLHSLYGADYNRRETVAAHSEGKHLYEICNSVLNADVIVSIPKMKTHYRVGTTLTAKGFVGLTGNKNLIPHRTLGDPEAGGDTYTRAAETRREKGYRYLIDLLKSNLLSFAENRVTAVLYQSLLTLYKVILNVTIDNRAYVGGCWYGNDTCWRSTVDLARIIVYCDRSGVMQDRPQRALFALLDGIVAGEGDGPMKATPKATGLLIGGHNTVAVDFIATRLMGFNPLHLKYIAALLKPHAHDLSCNIKELVIRSNRAIFENILLLKREETLRFTPPDSWKGRMELE